jgi:hypothetical protein
MRNAVYIFIFLVAVFVVISRFIKNEVIYVKSSIDSRMYLVRNLPDKHDAADLLAVLRRNIFELTNYLINNIKKFPEREKYINQLYNNIKHVDIKESGEDSIYTSYSVNKGEEIFFCLRSKRNTNKFHNLNLIMYVLLHELAHVATPEFGHTPLFKDNFKFITEEAIKLNLYKKIDFDNEPREYCGLMVTDSII